MVEHAQEVVRGALLPGAQALQLLHGALGPTDVGAGLVPATEKRAGNLKTDLGAEWSGALGL